MVWLVLCEQCGQGSSIVAESSIAFMVVPFEGVCDVEIAFSLDVERPPFFGCCERVAEAADADTAVQEA